MNRSTCPMRYTAMALLLALTSPLWAQDNDAEKLFAAMEKKIQDAKAFQAAVTIDIQGDAKDRVSTFRGAILLTRQNQARLRVSGDDFGEARNWELISDGKSLYLKPYAAMPVFKEEAVLPTPKHLHPTLTRVTDRMGIMLMLFGMTYIVEAAKVPDFEKAGDRNRLDVFAFKSGAVEKIDGRDAKVISFRVGPRDEEGVPVTLWLDSKTLLPLKRVSDLRKNKGVVSEVIITERYTAFTLDPMVDAGKAFAVPKVAVEPPPRDK